MISNKIRAHDLERKAFSYREGEANAQLVWHASWLEGKRPIAAARLCA